MTETPLLLIVRQRPAPHAELENLVNELQKTFQLDPFTTRQRLLGPGLTQLGQGERERLDAMAVSLRRHAHPCWVVAPTRPRFAPQRLRGLSIGDEAIVFHCEAEQQVRLDRGGAAVGVLADISGELAGKQVKRMLARNAYLGREQAVISPDSLRADILKGQPVFDCYLLDDAGVPATAFRVLPGRFNPEGLGGRAGLGAARNLEAVIDLVGEYAGTFRLHTDFGLSQLPGCLPQPANDNLALSGNLEALTRYGWLVAALAEPNVVAGGDREVTPGTVLATGVVGMAAVAGSAGANGELTGLAAAIDEAIAEPRPSAVSPPAPMPLPPPPDRPEQAVSLRRLLPVLGAFAGGLLLVLAGRTALLRPVIGQAVHSGLVPVVAAVALCWGAFACLRLKRRIEDTPTSRVRSLAMGLVEVQGRAIRRYALVAPMTQSACVWYRLRKYRRDSNNRWRLASQSDSNHVPFVLDDGSGQAVVDPAGATIKVKTEQTGYPGESSLIGAAVEGGPDEKWVEELIYEGTTLYVLGYARPERGVGPGLRERTVDVLRRLKLDPQALRRYDTNGDGRLDADEWQVARDEAERLAAAEQLQAQDRPAANHVVLGKAPGGLPFLIAEGQTGAELARRYGWGGGVLLVLGLAVFGLALKLCLEFFRFL